MTAALTRPLCPTAHVDGYLWWCCDACWGAQAGRGLVRYTDFADFVEEAFTKRGLERNPTATLDSRSKAIALAPTRSLTDLDPAAEELCKCVQCM